MTRKKQVRETFEWSVAHDGMEEKHGVSNIVLYASKIYLIAHGFKHGDRVRITVERLSRKGGECGK